MRMFLCILLGCFLFTQSSVAQSPVQIVPHKALYKMSLGSVKNGSTLQDVSGRMVFDWSDTCDGWAQQQHINFLFSFVDGSSSPLKSTMMTWESKKGGDYTFYTKRKEGETEEAFFKGRAKSDGNQTRVLFSLPQGRDEVLLPEGTIFPIRHVIEIIEKAQAKEKLFTRIVFDGAQDNDGQEQGVDLISSFIGAPRGKAVKGEVSARVVGHKLLQTTAWPIRMAFYEHGTKSSAPEYEMDMLLQADGIVRKIVIDYGDFTVVGLLEKIEKNKFLACPKIQ